VGRIFDSIKGKPKILPKLVKLKAWRKYIYISKKLKIVAHVYNGNLRDNLIIPFHNKNHLYK